MVIYKVRYFVNKRVKSNIKPYEYKETVVIDNLERAKEIYNNFKNEFQCSIQYSNYSGRCELFIPHLFDNGELAYWPDNNEYIEWTEK